MDKALRFYIYIIVLVSSCSAVMMVLSGKARSLTSEIIVEGADYVSAVAPEYSVNLAEIAENTAPRIIVEYADYISGPGLQDVIVPNIAPRIVIEYADSIYDADLEPIRWEAPSGFSIISSPASLTIQQGLSDTSQITVTSLNGFNQPIQLAVSVPPTGVTATLYPQQATPPTGGSITSTLTVSVGTTATPRSYTLTVTGTNGTLTRKVDIPLAIIAVPTEWTFAIITDLHIGRDYDNYNKQDYYLTARLNDTVQKIISQAATDQTRFVIVLGDLTEHGKPNEMQKVKEIMRALPDAGIPYFPVIGNHDIRSEKGDSVFQNTFDDSFFTAQCALLGTQWISDRMQVRTTHFQNYAFSYENKRFIFLDFVNRNGVIGWADLFSQTRDFLDGELNTDPSVFLFSHHPMAQYPAINEIPDPTDRFPGACFTVENIEDLGSLIGTRRDRILGNFAGHVHGYFDPEKGWDPDPILGEPIRSILMNPVFLDGNWEYASDFNTPGDIPVIGTEALMVGENDPSSSISKGVVRLVRMTQSGLPTSSFIESQPCLNPYIGDWTRQMSLPYRARVKFALYAFTKLWNTLPVRPITYSFSVDGISEESKTSSEVEMMFSDYHDLAFGTHTLKLTVNGYASDGSPVSESIEKTVKIGRFFIEVNCPVDVAITDRTGRMISRDTDEIPEANYTEADVDGDGDLEKCIEILVVDSGAYAVSLNGTCSGMYDIVAQFFTSEVVSFNATSIPISSGVIHRYIADWTALSPSEECVTVEVDSDGDGVFEHTFTSDSELSANEFLGVLTDINADGTVDIYDAIILSNAYGTTPSMPDWNSNADINGDNIVDIYDAILLANNYGKTA